jgi:hypothetical protein
MTSNSPPAGKASRRNSAREQAWHDLLKQFAASGQGIRGFCAARGLKETAFYFWRAEIQRRGGRVPVRRRRPAPARPAFARVLVQPPICTPVEVRRSGVR